MLCLNCSAGALSGLRSLSQLLLNSNRLTLLEWSVFEVLDFMEFGGHPGKISRSQKISADVSRQATCLICPSLLCLNVGITWTLLCYDIQVSNISFLHYSQIVGDKGFFQNHIFFVSTDMLRIFCSLLSAYLELSVEENELHCDARIQWIKQGEKQGWMELSYAESGILCENIPNTDWQDIPLFGNVSCESSYGVVFLLFMACRLHGAGKFVDAFAFLWISCLSCALIFRHVDM